MRSTYFTSSLAAVAALALAVSPAQSQDASRSIEGGGISVTGWMGQIDANEAQQGATIEDSRLSSEGDGMSVTTGPAVTYWNPDNRADGNYTVSATFYEAEYMGLNNHPHPYGIMIAGNDLGTDNKSALYCAAYGTGAFIVRGFGPEAFQVSARRPEVNDAVNKAAGTGEPVTQEIAITVTSSTVECAINGTTVASYPKANVVGAGKLKSTDGMYGIRFGHNTQAVVTGLKLTQN